MVYKHWVKCLPSSGILRFMWKSDSSFWHWRYNMETINLGKRCFGNKKGSLLKCFWHSNGVMLTEKKKKKVLKVVLSPIVRLLSRLPSCPSYLNHVKGKVDGSYQCVRHLRGTNKSYELSHWKHTYTFTEPQIPWPPFAGFSGIQKYPSKNPWML